MVGKENGKMHVSWHPKRAPQVNGTSDPTRFDWWNEGFVLSNHLRRVHGHFKQGAVDIMFKVGWWIVQYTRRFLGVLHYKRCFALNTNFIG